MYIITMRYEVSHTGVKIAVVAVMCKPHRCPHIAMTGNICVCVKLQTILNYFFNLLLGIVQEGPTRTLITAPRAILDTSRPACELSERGTIRMSRHEVE